MLNPRTPWPSCLLLLLAVITTASGERIASAAEAPLWVYATAVTIAWSLFTNVVVAFWLFRGTYKRQVAEVALAISNRSRLDFEAALRRMELLDRTEHTFLIAEERYVPKMVRCLRHLVDCCNHASAMEWVSASENCTAGLKLLADDAVTALDEADQQEIENTFRVNQRASEAYAGTRQLPVDEYGLHDLAARVAGIANDATTSPLAGLALLRRVAELAAAAATSSQATLRAEVRHCLLDSLLVGTIGVLHEQGEAIVRDSESASALGLDPRLVSNGRTAVARLEPIVAAVIQDIFGGASVDDVVQSVTNRWDGSRLSLPPALLDVNVNLFRRAQPPAYADAERKLASASRYWEDELAVTRINICIAAFMHWSGGRYAPRVATALADLAPHISGKFYSDAVRQLTAVYALLGGNSSALTDLEDLAASSSVLPVRKSTLDTLLWWYAKHRAFWDFKRINDTLRAVSATKGSVVSESKMEAVANRGVAVAKWYFITLPAGRVYQEWYPAAFSTAVA